MRQLEELRRQVRPEALLAVGAALVVMLGLSSWLYLLKPAVGRYQALVEKHEATVGGMQADPDGDTAAITSLEQELESLRDQLYGTTGRVPQRQIEAHVVDSLHRLAEQRAIELVGVKPGQPSPVLMFEELPYDVDVAGPYRSLYAWLADVESELRPMVVKQFSLEPDPGTPRVKLGLRLVAYRPAEKQG